MFETILCHGNSEKLIDGLLLFLMAHEKLMKRKNYVPETFYSYILRTYSAYQCLYKMFLLALLK